jgi:hypothetical protein
MLPDAIPPHNSAELPALAGDGNHTVVPSVPPRDASMASLEFALGIPISTDSHFSKSWSSYELRRPAIGDTSCSSLAEGDHDAANPCPKRWFVGLCGDPAARWVVALRGLRLKLTHICHRLPNLL